jgi:hypothetical protein
MPGKKWSRIMHANAAEFVQSLSDDGEAVGFIPGGALGEVLPVWKTVHR